MFSSLHKPSFPAQQDIHFEIKRRSPSEPLITHDDEYDPNDAVDIEIKQEDFPEEFIPFLQQGFPGYYKPEHLYEAEAVFIQEPPLRDLTPGFLIPEHIIHRVEPQVTRILRSRHLLRVPSRLPSVISQAAKNVDQHGRRLRRKGR